MDVFVSMLTNGNITRDNVGPHNDLLAEFPYLRPPHEDRQGEYSLALTAVGSIAPEGIEWKPFPAFPPSARLAVVVGNPSAQGRTPSESESPTA